MTDRSTCLKLRAAMNDVNKVLKQHGLVGDIGRITYNATEMRMKLTVVEVGAKAPVVASEQAMFAAYCTQFGFTAGDYGRAVKVMGIVKPVRLIGFKPKSKKYPILVQTVTGKKWKVQKHSVSFI